MYRDGLYIDYCLFFYLLGRFFVIVWNYGLELLLYMFFLWFVMMVMFFDFIMVNFCYIFCKWVKKVLGYVMICDSFIWNVILILGLKYINICILFLFDEEGGLIKMLMM